MNKKDMEYLLLKISKETNANFLEIPFGLCGYGLALTGEPLPINKLVEILMKEVAELRLKTILLEKYLDIEIKQPEEKKYVKRGGVL